MSVRPVFGIATFAAVLGLPSRPGAAPLVTKYRIAQQTEQEVDATALGGQKQTNKIGMSTFLTVTLADTAGGKAVHLVLDSIVADSGSQLPPQAQASLDSLKGSAYHAYLAGGKVANLRSMKDSASTSQVANLVTTLFPRVKPGTKAGQSWTDTTNTKTDIPNGSMQVRTVTNYKSAAGDAKGLRLDAATSSSFTGTQAQATIEGSGTGSGSYLLAADGHLVSGTIQQTSNLSVAVPQAPEPIPVTMKQSTTIATVK